MFVESKSRIVYVLGEDGMQPRACSGGGLYAGDGTLIRDGRQYLFVTRGIVKEIDVCKARLIYAEVMAGREVRAVPLAKPEIRKLAPRDIQECELIFRINGKPKCSEWVDSQVHEKRIEVLHELTRIDVQD